MSEKVVTLTTPPGEPGFFWALWKKACEGTHEGEELTPSNEWEIVHVVENCSDPKDPECLAVQVPGVREWQWREDFQWGPKVGDERRATEEERS